MPEDEKPAGRKPDHGPQEDMDANQSKRRRAPDQDVLPGILGKQLRAAYGEMLNVPIPDAFSELIKRLETREGSSDAAGASKPDREESDQ
jgi:Anti-sigma factor NepR